MLLEQITGQVERFTVTFVNTYLEKKVCDLFEKNLKHSEHLNVFIRVAGLGASCTFFFFFLQPQHCFTHCLLQNRTFLI